MAAKKPHEWFGYLYLLLWVGVNALVARPSGVTIVSLLVAVDCLDPTCSSHGVCVNGECLCSPGWGGLNCELARVQCPDQCSGHGTYLPDSGLCSCDPNWMGPDCSVGKPRGPLLSFSHSALVFRPISGWMGISSSPSAWDKMVFDQIYGAFLTLVSLALEFVVFGNEKKNQMIVLVPVPLWFHCHKWMTGPGGILRLSL